MSVADCCYLYEGEMFMSNLITEPKIAGFAQTTPRRASTCCELSDSEQKAICPLKRGKSVAWIYVSKSGHARVGRFSSNTNLAKGCKSCSRKFLWQSNEEGKKSPNNARSYNCMFWQCHLFLPFAFTSLAVVNTVSPLKHSLTSPNTFTQVIRYSLGRPATTKTRFSGKF